MLVEKDLSTGQGHEDRQGPQTRSLVIHAEIFQRHWAELCKRFCGKTSAIRRRVREQREKLQKKQRIRNFYCDVCCAFSQANMHYTSCLKCITVNQSGVIRTLFPQNVLKCDNINTKGLVSFSQAKNLHCIAPSCSIPGKSLVTHQRHTINDKENLSHANKLQESELCQRNALHLGCSCNPAEVCATR